MTDTRADLALPLAQQAAASEKLDAKSPWTPKLAARASIALSLTWITEALSQRTV
jgi:hypothetical protein